MPLQRATSRILRPYRRLADVVDQALRAGRALGQWTPEIQELLTRIESLDRDMRSIHSMDRPIPPRECPGCHEAFLPEYPRQIHHSLKCRRRFYNQKRRKKTVTDPA
jgi:hypothetical protein